MSNYRNTFEQEVGSILNSSWEYEPYTLAYKIYKDYKPDFVNGRVLVECKGYFRVGDTQKYKAIRDSLPEHELVFVLYDPNKKVRKGSRLTMSQWCDKEGFTWYTKENVDELNTL